MASKNNKTKPKKKYLTDSIKDGHSSFGRSLIATADLLNEWHVTDQTYFILMPISSSISPDNRIKSLQSLRTYFTIFNRKKRAKNKDPLSGEKFLF